MIQGSQCDKTAYAQLSQGVRVWSASKSNRQDCLRTACPVQSPTRDKNVFRSAQQGVVGVGGTACVASLCSSLLINPTHRMARPPFRHIHRAGAWINPHKPRQGSQIVETLTSRGLLYPEGAESNRGVLPQPPAFRGLLYPDDVLSREKGGFSEREGGFY